MRRLFPDGDALGARLRFDETDGEVVGIVANVRHRGLGETAIVELFFNAVALLLAGIGVYGLTSYTVGQRRQEIGIRVALGARASDVIGMDAGNAMMLTAIGLGIGLLGAVALAQPLAVLLFDIGPYDAATFVLVPALLASIAAVAAWLTARRAAKVDPLSALRPD